MNIQVLPQDITTINGGSVQLHEYAISKSLDKNKVQLSKNVISFLIEGIKELIMHHSSTTIESNKFLIIKSGNCLMSENIALSNNYRSMLLFFPNEAVELFIKKYNIELDKKEKNEPFIICDYDHYIRNIVAGLITIKEQPNSFLDTVLPIKLEEIFLYLVQKKGSGFLQHFIETSHNTEQSFMQTMQKNVFSNLSVAELAFLCNMSISTFKRYFEKEFNTSPINWFQEQRLAHSAYLLKIKKRRPSDIYEEIGYETLSSFTQAYKQKFGITPKQAQLSN